MTLVLLGISNDLVTEDDPDLAVRGFAFDGLEPGLLGGVGIDPLHVGLEPAHQQEDPDQHQRPHDEHSEKEALIWGHAQECRV